MATKPSGRTGGFNLKIPDTLTLKDMITIVSVAVSLAMAWGVFSTRISLLEQEVLAQSAINAEQKEAIKAAERHAHEQDIAIQRIEILLDQQSYPRDQKPIRK